MWNQLEYRPLEGFVYAITPFNFTAIGGNLPTAPALMGNTVLWKPASSAMLSAWYTLKLLEEAGLPPGVINFVPGDAAMISEVALEPPRPRRRALHRLHRRSSTRCGRRSGPGCRATAPTRASSGETGGKDFIVAHPSADPQALAVAIVRGGFEYQGQKCSAASRVYVPRSLWSDVRDRAVAMMREIRMGDVADFRNFMGAVIDERAFEKIGEYLAEAQAQREGRVRRQRARREGLVHRADAGGDGRSRASPALRGDLRPRGDRARLRRREVDGDAAGGRLDLALRADGVGLRPGPAGGARGLVRAAPRRRQLLHQRQAHGRRGRPAAVRRGARRRARTTRRARC